MKKQAISVLVVITLVFTGFTAGYFLGRNHTGGDIQLSIPAALLTEPAQTTTAAPDETEAPISFPIDLNTAGEAELQALPGIGPVLAQRILTYRQEHGAFSSVEELLAVSGIGEKRLDAIDSLVTIGGQDNENTGRG